MLSSILAGKNPMPPVHALRVSNPFFEGANTVYVIESDPLTLIDTGVATQIAYDRLVAQFEENGLRIADVGRIILTHKHIDHIGNAWRIQEQTGAEVLIHESELKSIENVDEQGERFVTLLNRRFEVWDVPSRQYADNKQMPPWEIKPTRGSALQDGQKIDVGDEVLQVIHTPGHTMGSICLLSERHLFSGDHVLEKISPNVGGGDIRQDGLLRHFLQSLQRVQDLASSHLVMPGHGQPFENVTQRCIDLAQHHEERLLKTREILSDRTMSVYEVASELFGELDDFHVFLGCAEANAHLEYLVEEGLVEKDENRYRLGAQTS